MNVIELEEEGIGLLAEDPLTTKDEFNFETSPLSKKRQILVAIGTYSFWLSKFSTRFITGIFPSFIASNGQQVKEELRPTAFLDGLRGIAAWTVFNSHVAAILVKSSGAGFGHLGENFELFKLPIARLLYAGPFAVAIFFVISGFALSVSPVLACRAPERDLLSFAKKLSGTVFRRPLRLFLPAVASTFIVFFLLRIDYFDNVQHRMHLYEKYVTGWNVPEQWPYRTLTVWAQLRDWLLRTGEMFEIFLDMNQQRFEPRYNGVLWTIKLEWRCSLALYLTHAALFPMAKRARIAMLILLIIFALAIGTLDMPHFWAGYAIAEYSQLTRHEPSNATDRGFFAHVLSWLVLLLGAYLGSFPGWDAEHTPGYSWMLPYTPFNFQPVDRFWCGVGGALMIWSLRRIPILTKILSSSIIQYMGKISFSFYLVHFFIVQGMGWEIFYRAWSITGNNSFWPGLVGFCIGYAILLGIVIWAADVFWRAIDTPSVNLAVRLQKILYT